MKSLQAMFDAQLSDLPRLIATRLVEDKLEVTGRGGDDELLASIVERLLGDGRDEDEEEVGADAELVISFGEDDLRRAAELADRVKEGLPDLIETISDEAARRMLAAYQRDWAAWRVLADLEKDHFRARLQARWERGFDALRMLIELSRDLGVEFHRRARRSRSPRRVHVNDALHRLHCRSIQIASEIMVLMENGHADGAMARWRTLHEVACVAMMLKDGGDALAERYLLHERVEARKALAQYDKCHVQLGYAPFSRRAAERIEREHAAVIARFGRSFGGDYGWAADHLGKPNPGFAHVEEAAGQAMMRSHYKMASHNVHAGTKGISYRLGSLDREFTVFAGASNVGFVEPGQNLATSLLQITMLLIREPWTLDKIAQLKALIALRHRVPKALARSERAIERNEKARERSLAKRKKRANLEEA